MILLRIVAILTAIAIASSMLAWLITRNQSYLVFAVRVMKGALGFCLFALLLMVAERLLIP